MYKYFLRWLSIGTVSFNRTYFFPVLDTDYFLCCCCISGCDGSSDVSVGSCGLYLIRNKCIYCPHNLHEGTVFILFPLSCSLWISRAKKSLVWHRSNLPVGIRKLPTYPPPPLGNINTYLSLRAKCWLRGGVGGQFPRNPARLMS